jgi:hypothetical protein
VKLPLSAMARNVFNKSTSRFGIMAYSVPSA